MMSLSPREPHPWGVQLPLPPPTPAIIRVSHPRLPDAAAVRGVRPEGPAPAEVHPQEPAPVQGVVRGQLHLLRVPDVRPHPAEHHLPGHAGRSGGPAVASAGGRVGGVSPSRWPRGRGLGGSWRSTSIPCRGWRIDQKGTCREPPDGGDGTVAGGKEGSSRENKDLNTH